MQYLITIYEDEKIRAARKPEDMPAIMQRWWKLNDKLKEAGAFIAADALESTATATTVRTRDGKTTFTDGPFAETAEQLGGYYLIEVENLDEALKWAAEIPVAETGSVEVRPILMLPQRPPSSGRLSSAEQQQSPQEAVAEAYRHERGRVLAALRRVTGSLEEAEDALAIAFERALSRWVSDGVPDRPGAWLLKVARNEALGVHRHRKMAEEKHQDVAFPGKEQVSEPEEASDYPDERLSLLFTCCHPALKQEAQVALTLSTLSGLSTTDIAKAFVVPEPTMAQRIVRAKKKIRDANIPYQVPARSQLPDRIAAVYQVVYLIFTEGYRASTGDRRLRIDLCEDALLLAHALTELLPEEPEAKGLEALLWFHHARRRARLHPDGDLVFLEEQDRSLFVHEEIVHAEELLISAVSHKELGPYQLQAAIAAQHCMAPIFEATPWDTIVQLYNKLYEFVPSPVVALNRAAAMGLGEGPEVGLQEMERQGLARSLHHFAPYHAARGEFLSKLGDQRASRGAFEKALSLVKSAPEIAHLRRRISEVAEN